MFENLTKTGIYAMLTGIFTASLIISNIIASKTFDFFLFTLPSSVIIFPIIYIVNDVLAEVYGFKKAKKVILLGFIMNLVAVICYQITLILPAPPFFENADAFVIVFGSSFRILVASFIAYLVGSLVNAKLMVLLKGWDKDKLFLRCILSTLCGEGIDSMIFITIGFIGTMPLESLILMIAVQALFKTLYEIVVYPLTKYVIGTIKALPEY